MTVPSLKIGIAGISGRVGRLLAEEVIGAGFILAGGSARHPSSVKGLLANVPLFADFSALADASDVVIDFTHADTSARHAEILADYGKALVLGTTGLSPEQEAAVKAAAKKIAVVHAANFSPGVTLVRRLARMMGQALPAESYDVEIVEMHHRQKVDAPSGTALAIGESVADGRGVSLADVKDSGRDGHTGARKTGDIGFAALRGGQIVGEHEVLFTSADEQIRLSHRAFDRRIFATGAVRAADWVRNQPAGYFGMEDVLGLPPL
ncbi:MULTISPECIES: 4-hydroxy-tetrahydrodipicolinate reductase [Acetobacter]|uniref:4-hydroxy-tetrahydrodipicolinate reductase n=1 Tax=Acetobacter TaxID=434 RepID=UPI000A35F932|nr:MULTISPECIES: 4-hydroxy-tetrahydrodipicolinate reductase [Acetobacter]MBS0960871.1 4-hydroxy-tetrahydrodipicolinate reductase [Acetobacter thailandicus]MBS0981252.1 4-hydroxy-tetrahydrodipicolinate reductase [Acetobacter thailandicus]MBS0986314.1 4-hydroxy-tetrahydrodipicolinate reductase [Acetobacter thailandicus]OUJ12151.1 dihydrodipicolinate reductase [Acetobacter sp. DsW_059]